MARLIPTFAEMFRERLIPICGGVWIDIYNKSANPHIAGTIHTRIDHGNYWYVTELRED